MSAWRDRVADLTLFEALTGGAFDLQNGNIAGNLTNFFQKSQMPRGLPGGKEWAVLELTGTLVLSADVKPENNFYARLYTDFLSFETLKS